MITLSFQSEKHRNKECVGDIQNGAQVAAHARSSGGERETRTAILAVFKTVVRANQSDRCAATEYPLSGLGNPSTDS